MEFLVEEMPKTEKISLIVLEVSILAIINVGAYCSSGILTLAFPYSSLFRNIFFISIIAFDLMYICSKIPVVKKYTCQNNKILLIIFDVIILAVPTVVAYFGSMRLLGFIGYSFLPYLGHRWDIPYGIWNALPLIFLVTILAFDVLWSATIKFWPLIIHIKIILTFLVLAFNAALVTVLIGQFLLRDFKW